MMKRTLQSERSKSPSPPMGPEIYRRVLEAAPNAMIMVGQNGKIVLVNKQGEALFGYSRKELIGKSIELLLPKRARKAHVGYRTEFFNEPSTRAMGAGRDLFGLRKDGSEVPIEIGLNPIETPNEVFTLASIIDIAERKKLEELEKQKVAELTAYNQLKNFQAQLIQSEKLASLGQLSAGVAHELNSPLQGLVGLLEIHLERAAKDSSQSEQLKEMLAAAQRMVRIVNDLNSFARRSKGEKSRVDVHDVIDSTLSFSEKQLVGNGIEVVKKYTPNCLEVWGDKNQLQQVVINMLTNARDAMPEGGKWVICTSKMGDNIILSFSDTGRGISKENLARVFDPFFTTKPSGKGTGLGLSIIHGIIQDHGGEIFLESKEGKGAKFSISLPIYKA